MTESHPNAIAPEDLNAAFQASGQSGVGSRSGSSESGEHVPTALYPARANGSEFYETVVFGSDGKTPVRVIPPARSDHPFGHNAPNGIRAALS